MARRGHGEGSISRRAEGRYEGRYYADTSEGRKRKAVYGKTRKEVAEKLAGSSNNELEGIVKDVLLCQGDNFPISIGSTKVGTAKNRDKNDKP